jgi:cytoskeleton protein RodZ
MGLAGLALVVAVIWWVVYDPEEEAGLKVAQSDSVRPAEQTFSSADLGFVPPSQEWAVSNQAGLAFQLEQKKPSRAIDVVEIELAETVGDNRKISSILMAEESLQESAIERSISEQSISKKNSPDLAEKSVKLERTTDRARRLFTLDASGPDQLELSFSDECWVEIEDSQFGLIYNDLNQADDVLTIFGTGPFKVLLGKATGVEMIYNGSPFELEPFVGRDRTAKITVSN